MAWHASLLVTDCLRSDSHSRFLARLGDLGRAPDAEVRVSGVALRTPSARPPAAEHRGFAPEANGTTAALVFTSASSGTGRNGRTGAERTRWTAPCGSIPPAATQGPSPLKQTSCPFTTDRADDPDGCYSTARRQPTRWRRPSPALGPATLARGRRRQRREGGQDGRDPPPPASEAGDVGNPQGRALKATPSLEDDFSGSTDWHPRTTSPTTASTSRSTISTTTSTTPKTSIDSPNHMTHIQRRPSSTP